MNRPGEGLRARCPRSEVQTINSDKITGSNCRWLKTRTVKTGASVDEFMAAVDNKRRREDGLVLLEMMRDVSGLEPEMWGPSIIGFGSYHYRYESGREGDMPLIGFSPRKQSLSLYIMSGFGEYDELLGRLGKHRTGAFVSVHQQAGGRGCGGVEGTGGEVGGVYEGGWVGRQATLYMFRASSHWLEA